MVTFSNGVSIDTENINYSTEELMGELRPVLDIVVEDTDDMYKTISDVFNDQSALSLITITQNTGIDSQATFEYNYYSLPISITRVQTSIAKTITLRVAQLTVTEIQQRQIISDNEDIQMALIELADILG